MNTYRKVHICTEPLCLPKMASMMHFGNKLTERLGEINMTKYRLAKISNVPESSVINIANGKRRPTDENLEKFAAVKELGVSINTLRMWRALDEYTLEELKGATEIAEQLRGQEGQ